MRKKSLSEFQKDATAEIVKQREEFSKIGDPEIEGQFHAAADALQGAVNEGILAADPLPRTPVTLTIPCRITPEEKAEAAQLMAAAVGDLADCQARKKEMTAQYKAEEEQHNSAVARHARTVRSEFEHREVACERVIDYAAGEARTYRKDTQEMVNFRPLTASEMQTKMELETHAVEPEDDPEQPALDGTGGEE